MAVHWADLYCPTVFFSLYAAYSSTANFAEQRLVLRIDCAVRGAYVDVFY